MLKNSLEALIEKEGKFKYLTEKGFLIRDLFLGFFIFCAVGKVLGLISSGIIDIWIISIITALASTTYLRKRLYRDKLKSVQLKIAKLSMPVK